MRLSTSLLVAGLLAETSLASILNHRHFFMPRAAKVDNIAVVDKNKPVTSPSPVVAAEQPAATTTAPSAAAPTANNKASSGSSSSSSSSGSFTDYSKFYAAGGKQAAGGDASVGSGGPYTAEFSNTSGDNVILVVWGNVGSWVNNVAPQVVHGLAPGQSITVSFKAGFSGGWAGYYPNTQLVNGQISETWGEVTFNDPYSTYDVSREVNMSGHSMSISGGEGCLSDMNTCVFKCVSGNTCLTGYDLYNCETGSQTGAGKGAYAGAASGGCTGSYNGKALKVALGA